MKQKTVKIHRQDEGNKKQGKIAAMGSLFSVFCLSALLLAAGAILSPSVAWDNVERHVAVF